MDHPKQPLYPLSKNRTESPISPIQPRRHRILWRVLAALVALYLLLNIGGKCRVVISEYEISDPRITRETRICVLSDLHNARYGANQSQLVEAVAKVKPDVVLLLGDLFDQHGSNANTSALLRELSSRYTCFFILGNHEYKTKQIQQVIAEIQAINIPILAGKSVLLDSNIRIFGIDDGMAGKLKQQRQIRQAGSERSDAEYSILAIHVPNGVQSYLPYGFDLMLSGHTHGGQIILPGLLNGLYAPGQGFFPKFAGGRYELDKMTLIISRGLARKPLWLPRVFNPPELVLLDLKPE
jgi:predicted MPP superfamily phosphohydrolase